MKDIQKKIISAQLLSITSCPEEDRMRVLANFVIDRIIEIHTKEKGLDSNNNKIYNHYKHP